MSTDPLEVPAPTPAPANAVPKALGIVHIIYGLLLILAGAGWGIYLLGIPLFLDFAQTAVRERTKSQQESNERRIAEIDEEIAQTDDDAKKDDLLEQKTDLEISSESAPAFTFPTLGLSSAGPVFTLGFELFTGLLLYGLMMIAGIGLILRKRWGRFLALGIAAIKIVQVVVVSGLYVGMLGPVVTNGIREEMTKAAELAAQDPPPEPSDEEPAPAPATPEPTPDEIAGQVQLGILIHALGNLLFGLIYPIVTIYLLTRPAVRAAFAPTPGKGLTA